MRATVNNAQKFLEVIEEFGSFDKYIWQFTGGKTIHALAAPVFQPHLGDAHLAAAPALLPFAVRLAAAVRCHPAHVLVHDVVSGADLDGLPLLQQGGSLAQNMGVADSPFSFGQFPHMCCRVFS
ncbi:MAG: DNA-3-methyladenine glycosylase I [Sedimentisphaerales bacterium]|nr:DNA-3-methyladenine glycosylase I [Sedimentisphaerales bacterium]